MKVTQRYFDELKSNYSNIPDIEKLQGKRVLITGVTGLIGSTIADMLLGVNEFYDLNMTIFLSGRNINKIFERFFCWGDKYHTIRYDALTDFEFEEYVDYIIHCASPAHPQAYADCPVETLLTNVIGTNNLLQYAKSVGVERFLYISSSEVYGKKEKQEPYREDEYLYVDILNPRACYPSGKRAAETLCASYEKEYDVDIVIVRPGHVYGPTITDSDTRAHAQFVRDVINGRDIVMKSTGLQLRSYCHVFDCATAILTVLLRGKRGDAYNISNKKSVVTIKELAEMHAKLTGHKVVYDVPSEAEQAGYNMMTCSALNSDKLYELGWAGIYDLEEGVRNTIDTIMSE